MTNLSSEMLTADEEALEVDMEIDLNNAKMNEPAEEPEVDSPDNLMAE
jgi:hypothetical protein